GEALQRRTLALKGASEPLAELGEAAEGDFRHQGVAATKMAVEGRRRDADELCRIGEREPAQAPLGDEALRRFDQRLLEVAVVIALPVERAAPVTHDDPALPCLTLARPPG